MSLIPSLVMYSWFGGSTALKVPRFLVSTVASTGMANPRYPMLVLALSLCPMGKYLSLPLWDLVRLYARALTSQYMHTKSVYVWMGLQTYIAPFVNGSHTLRHIPKFVGFLCEYKGNWQRCVLCSPETYGKLIYHTRSVNCLNHSQTLGLHVCTGLKIPM